VPIVPCLAVVVFASLLNVILHFTVHPMQRLEPTFTAWLLALNIAELGALLFLTGGLQNPFSFLFLGPVLISATALPPRLTLALGLFATLCATALGFFHLPLPWTSEEPLALPPVYLIGIWLSIVLAIGVTSLYAFQVTQQARKLTDALAATELIMAREQHLSQLDGLAAAAAHELGTPLSTITVIARELERTVDPATPLGAEVRTLRDEAQRCRDILGKLTQLSSTWAPFDRMALSALLEEVVAPHRHFDIRIEVALEPGDAPEPIGARNPAILYGLGNIVENAVDFAREKVIATARWDRAQVEIIIADDGPGIAPDLLKRIGEPYLSRRRGRGEEDRGGGLGLGVFIARTLLERSGARIRFNNRVFPEHGAVVSIAWNRDDFESPDAGETVPAEASSPAPTGANDRANDLK
jgi:two-component system sensor histidine kinase RegB